MDFLYVLMTIGILLALLKLIGVFLWVWWIEERSTHIYKIWKDEWSRSVLLKTFLAFVTEVVIAIGIGVCVRMIYSLSEEFGNRIVIALTSTVSVGWFSFYVYTIWKTIVKFSAKLNS